MLAIRLQRTGRRGHAQFRVIVQDRRFHPTRGKIVAYLGSYDPHTKIAQIDKELAAKYLNDGAQPSDRIAKMLKAEGVKLPAWVEVSPPKKSSVRNPDKRRSTRPEAPAEEAPKQEEAPVAEEASAEAAQEETTAEAPAEPAPENATEEAAAEEKPAEETATEEQVPTPEAPAEEPQSEAAAETEK